MLENHLCYPLKNYIAKTLVVESKSLIANPLKDSSVRYTPIITPIGKGDYPVVLVLSGFTGTGQKYVGYRSFEKNMAQVIDLLTGEKKAPLAHYIFVDAMTYWGGSQFVNSKGCGQYEDYIVIDLRNHIIEQLGASSHPESWVLMGGSSGGYGALHIGSKYPTLFGHIGAIAPDSDFQKSLLTELLTAVPYFSKIGGIEGIRKEMDEGLFFRRKNAHAVLNAVAMNLCYSGNDESSLEWPIDLISGDVIEEKWHQWKQHDPLIFLEHRAENLRKLHSVYLDVGKFDQYHLQYGSRKISQVLTRLQIVHSYTEFNGGHHEISDRRPQYLEYINKKYS